MHDHYNELAVSVEESAPPIAALHPAVPRLRRRRRLPLRGPRAARTRRLRDHRRADRVRPGRQRPGLVDPVQLAPDGSLGDALLVGPGEPARQRADAAHHGDARRPHLHGDPRGRTWWTTPGCTCGARACEGRTLQAALAPMADGIKVRGQTPFVTPWRTIQLADRATDLAPSLLGLNLNPPNALRQHRLDPSDEVRRHLVGHAHRHHDLELGAEARRDDGECPTVHRFRRGQRLRRRAGRGMEYRLGRRLDREPRRLLVHPGLSRLRSRRRRRATPGRRACG